MTGKEALEYIANLLFMFTSTGRKSGKNYTLKALCTIEDELDKLTKYKRAFEILKNKLKIGVCLQDDYPDGWTLYGGGTKNITKEEYELLEELINNESR